MVAFLEGDIGVGGSGGCLFGGVGLGVIVPAEGEVALASRGIMNLD